MPREHLDPERLAALAAGERPDPETAGHLEGCLGCARALQDLDDVARLLASMGGERLEVPREAVWERVREEALAEDGATSPPGHVPAPAPTPAPTRGPASLRPVPSGAVAEPAVPASTAGSSGGPRRPRRTLVAALAGLAAGVALGVGGALVATSGAQEPERADVPVVAEPGVVVARADLAPLRGDGPAGTASLVRGPDRARLWVELPSGGGSVPRQVWLLDERSDLVAVGMLGDGQAGVFEVPLDVVESHQVVDVSAEPLDGDPAHSGDTLFRGALVDG